MSWSYSGDPRQSVRDAVRFEIQDTNPKAQLLTNEEILYAVREEAPGKPPSEGEVLSAAARCMEALARLFRAQADTTVGSLSTAYTKQSAGYEASAEKLRLRASGKHAPWFGGESAHEKEVWASETDLEPHVFRRDLFHNPYVRPSGSSSILSGVQVHEGEQG